MKHTPGPWKQGEGLENNLKTDVFIGPHCIDVGTEEDAALMAAAPEMLEALNSIRDILAYDHHNSVTSTWDAELDIIDSAIAKATGKYSR